MLYTGIGSRLLEKSQKQNQNQTLQISTVKAKLDLTKKGFDIHSPRMQSPANSRRQSPAGSGRSTPIGDDGSKSSQKNKEQSMQDAKELFAKERGNEKPHIHLVVIGHVDAGKSTLLGMF